MVNSTQANGNHDDSDSDGEQQEEVETSRDLNSINHLFTVLSHDTNYLSIQLQNNSIHVNGDNDFDDNEFEDAD
ncbi:hypothetical protein FQA39_LY05522 [Lamprigera yunnana]|nr:hypothetical protein FQA39_LY05522 [Lamprigera yunnana]